MKMLVQLFWKRRLAHATGVLLLAFGLISNQASAQQAVANPPVVIKPVPVEVKPVDWVGLGWGLGIATNFDVGGKRVNTASVINNIVRIEDTSSNVSVSFVLEAHYFLRDYFFGFGSRDACTQQARSSLNCTELAHGPFVAIEVGGGSSASPAATGPITGYAMGWMVGMRHPSLLPDIASSKASWNVGVGLRVSPNGKILGDGLVANQPLPAGDSIRYKTEPRLGLMLMSTFSF
jgi:hypothetical protein